MPGEHHHAPMSASPGAVSEADASIWPRTPRARILVAVIVPIVAAFAAWVSVTGSLALAPVEGVMLGILLVAAGYWALEPITAVATSLLVIALIIACIGLPAHLGAPWALAATGVTGWTQFLAPAGSSVMLLMLGSLSLALGAHRTGLDHLIGAAVVRRAGNSPWRLVITLMAVSAFLSLWTSNTATGALMIAVIRPIWDMGPDQAVSSPSRRKLAAACVMAVAIGANVGGIGSPVGTPPSAIVFTALDQIGAPITFLGWCARGLPLAVILLFTGFVAMWFTMRPWGKRVDLSFATTPHHSAAPPSARGIVVVTFVVTAGLWITSAWTGIPVAVVALVPLVVLPATGVIRPMDFAHLEWDVLLLILGGLVIGAGLESTGLATAIVGRLPLDSMSPLVLVVAMTIAAVVLSAFMSNTAVANLLTPIAMSLALGVGIADEHGVHALAVPLGFAVALGSGISMMLPVATPANAMAHRTGAVSTTSFLWIGTTIAIAGVIAITVAAFFATC